LRQPTRTLQCKLILLILHTSRIPSSTCNTSLYSKYLRFTKHASNNTYYPRALSLLIRQSYMTSMYHRFYSKDTFIQISLMTPQSPHRSPY
uniref:Uncharacterized protein n=1 Tax=Piliocolobus tephrosceles TaxID=591936 RepID=A0A8C9IM48_9PRIM